MFRLTVALAILAGLLAVTVFQASGKARSATSAQCSGEYRWDIKTLSDGQPTTSSFSQSTRAWQTSGKTEAFS
jgi:hypothetical protein